MPPLQAALILLVVVSRARALYGDNDTLANGWWNGTTSVTYNIQNTSCQNTISPISTILNYTDFMTSSVNGMTDDALTNGLQISVDARPPDRYNSTPNVHVITDTAKAGYGPPVYRYWNLSAQTQGDGTRLITGRLVNDTGDESQHLFDFNVLNLENDGTPCEPDSHAGIFHLAKGAEFMVKAYTNGSVTFDMLDAPLWCEGCAIGDNAPFEGSVHYNVGSLSMSFVNWVPEKTSRTIRPAAPGLSALLAIVIYALVFRRLGLISFHEGFTSYFIATLWECTQKTLSCAPNERLTKRRKSSNR